MALNRWSLDRLVAWTGMAALLVLVVPPGVYFTLSISSLAERVQVVGLERLLDDLQPLRG